MATALNTIVNTIAMITHAEWSRVLLRTVFTSGYKQNKY